MTARNLVSVVLIVAAAVLGFLFGTASNISKSSYSPAPAPLASQSSSSVSQNPIFKSQSAIFQGVITQVSGRNISLKDDKGMTASFAASANAMIYKFNGTSPQAVASSDLKSIDTGKQVLVTLQLMDGQYQIISVSYLPSTPPPAAK